MSRRAYCRCQAVRNYDYDEAAAKLGCQPQWLKDNVGKLPRQKFGHNPAVFCECELALIQQMHTVLPDNVAELLAGVGARDPQGDDDHQAPAGEVGRPALASLVPAAAHSRKAS